MKTPVDVHGKQKGAGKDCGVLSSVWERGLLSESAHGPKSGIVIKHAVLNMSINEICEYLSSP